MLGVADDLWWPTIAGAARALPLSKAALGLDFTKPDYWVGGVHYATLNAIPGYAFARAGQQGAPDAAGVVSWFGPNVPARNSAGFHAYGAATNQILQSQNLGTLTQSGLTIAQVAQTVPDGTLVCDKLSEVAGVSSKTAFQLTNPPAGNVNTVSCYLKAAGRRYAFIRILYVVSNSWVTALFDLQTGTLVSTGLGGPTFVSVSGYAVPASQGFTRCVLRYTVPAPVQIYCCLNLSDTPTPNLDPNNGDYTFNGVAGSGVYAWQFQAVDGDHPSGGPLIVTGAATANIGASALSLGLANGNYTAKYSFSDGTSQAIATAIAAAVFNHPVTPTLNRGIVKSTVLK